MTNTTTTPDLSALGLGTALQKPTRPCACGWTVVLPGDRTNDLQGRPKAHREAAEYDAETDSTYVDLGCEARTQGTFAPGHDARLKGLAQTAALYGGDLLRDGLTVGPRDLLGALAPNLVRFVDEAVEAAEAKAKAKAEAAEAKAKAEAAKPKAAKTEAKAA